MPRDKILADLTAPGTPYWRLKTLMDAWCALWFWPLDKAALLDGSDEVYQTAALPSRSPSRPSRTPAFPDRLRNGLPLRREPEQLTLAEAAPRKPRPKNQPSPTTARGPAARTSTTGSTSPSPSSAARTSPPTPWPATSPPSRDMAEYEDKLESDFYMGMDPV